MSRIFVDVDTLNDFFANGALPVPNADKIRPVLKDLNDLAKDSKIPVLKFSDNHDGLEPEMINNGGPFPLHCLTETSGAASIIETANNKALVFEKRTYDCFDKNLGNPNIDEWLKKNKVTEAWVYGVCTEYCILAAVIGLCKRNITTYIFENAIQHLNEEEGNKAKQKMRSVGAHFVQAKL